MKNKNVRFSKFGPKNKNFGLLFSTFFLIFSLYGFLKPLPLYINLIFCMGSVIFFITALLSPWILTPLNKAWFNLGLILGKIVSPIILGAVFFLFITPVAVVSRIFARDELRLLKKNSNSYWINREAPKPDSKSFKNQF